MIHAYTIDFKEFNSHFVNVTYRFNATSDNPTIWLPTWIAGSYLIREFSKNISQVLYAVGDGNKQRAEKISKNRWQIMAKAGDSIVVSYPAYCYDLSVRTAYVDSERIFGNFSSLLLMTGDGDEPCQIDLKIPKAFYTKNAGAVIACGLKHQALDDKGDTIYRFDKLPNGQPLTAFESNDFPFEIAVQSVFDFATTCNGKAYPHRFFIAGQFDCDESQLKKDVQAICQSYADTLGWMPFDDYTFMTYASKNDYGGLEHINSTALVTPRDDLPMGETDGKLSDEYLRYLGLCSHEYFHSWWVKSVRPDVMMTSRLQDEAYTPLLWVFEGFTSYIDDLMLYVSGRVDKAQYFELLASQISRYLNTLGRFEQTVAESSFDAWIKLYRPDENSQNSTVSYYNKGAIVAWGLDLLLADYGYRLFDVVREFVGFAKNAPNARFGMDNANLDTVMEKFLPSAVWVEFRDNYVKGVSNIPFEKWLNKQGVTLNINTKDEPFGIVCESNAGGLLIKRLHPKASASVAGLSANDTIIAIDGLKADTKGLQKALVKAKQGKSIHIHAFRRDMLLEFDLMVNEVESVNVKVTLNGDGAWLEK